MHRERRFWTDTSKLQGSFLPASAPFPGSHNHHLKVTCGGVERRSFMALPAGLGKKGLISRFGNEQLSQAGPEEAGKEWS